MIILICSECEKEYPVKPYRKNSSKTCSPKCRGKYVGKLHIGNTYCKGRPAWNKNIKGLHLNPNTEFKKGNEPWNKNLKGIHLHPKTEFKKGLIPKNKLSVGTITIRVYRGTARRFIKIKEPNIWIHYANYLWYKSGREKEIGKCLHHINCDSLDDRIENYKYVTREEHPTLHNRWNTKNYKLKKLL